MKFIFIKVLRNIDLVFIFVVSFTKRHDMKYENINKLAYDLLLSLTPGGSEFVNEPQRCFDFVKEREDFKHKKIVELTNEKKEIRAAIADYMQSEGCSCCQDYEAHKKHKKRLAKLLSVKPYSDGSGYDFTPYRTDKK